MLRYGLHKLLRFDQNLFSEKIVVLCFVARSKGHYFQSWNVQIHQTET
jgi:hypothetical protein